MMTTNNRHLKVFPKIHVSSYVKSPLEAIIPKYYTYSMYE